MSNSKRTSPFYAAAIFLWLWIPIRYLDWYGYKYPVIKNGFIILTVANMLIPLLAMVLSGIFTYYQRKRLSLILKIFTIICVVIGYIWLSFECVAINSICSETTKPQNYGKYDNCIPKELLNGLPEKIPEDAQDIQYYYFAEKEAYFYIAVSWRYDDVQKLESAIEQMQSINCIENESQIVWALDNKNVAVITDKDELRIYYVACIWEEYLPENTSEIYWNFRKEWLYETSDAQKQQKI